MQQQNKNDFMGFDTIEINLVTLLEILQYGWVGGPQGV